MGLWARPGVLIAISGIVVVVGWYLGVPKQLAQSEILAGRVLLVAVVTVAWYLYSSSSVRNFYAVLRGNTPTEIVAKAKESDPQPGKSAAMGSGVQLLLEYVLLLTGLGLLVAAFAQMSQ